MTVIIDCGFEPRNSNIAVWVQTHNPQFEAYGLEPADEFLY